MFVGCSNVRFPTCKFCVSEERYMSVGISTWEYELHATNGTRESQSGVVYRVSAGKLVPRRNSLCDSVFTCEVCFPIEIHRRLTKGVPY